MATLDCSLGSSGCMKVMSGCRMGSLGCMMVTLDCMKDLWENRMGSSVSRTGLWANTMETLGYKMGWLDCTRVRSGYRTATLVSSLDYLVSSRDCVENIPDSVA